MEATADEVILLAELLTGKANYNVAEFDGIDAFHKSGYRRLRDAEALMELPTTNREEQGAKTRHLRGAMYLSGYGVECLLKAFLISRYPPSKRLSEVVTQLQQAGVEVQNISGSAGHNLPYLLTLTGLEARMDARLRQQMSHCAKWRSSWRYNPDPPRQEDAEQIVWAARRMVEWINTQI